MNENFNRRKISILNRMASARWYTVKRIYELSEDKSRISIFSIRMALLRYHRQGLLNRRKTGHHREYEYKLSKRGIDRLKWLVNIQKFV